MYLRKNNQTHANKVYNFLKKKNKPLSAYEILEELTKDDTIISIKVLDGIENLKLNA